MQQSFTNFWANLGPQSEVQTSKKFQKQIARLASLQKAEDACPQDCQNRPKTNPSQPKTGARQPKTSLRWLTQNKAKMEQDKPKMTQDRPKLARQQKNTSPN